MTAEYREQCLKLAKVIEEIKAERDSLKAELAAARTKQACAYESLTKSLEARNTALRAGQAEWQEAVKTLQSERDMNSILTFELAALRAKNVPLAEVIEQLENDGTGWTAKIRWIYNPVPVGELLFWPDGEST